MRNTLLLLALLSFTAHLSAQLWVDHMTDGVTNVHTVAEEYDAYWQDHTIDRGKGWKQFQRWYWSMEPRTFPSGERPDPGHYASALKHVKRMVRGDGAKSANWTSLGPTAWTSSSYSPGLGRVNVLYEDPSDPAVLYAGTPAGGLWRSTDSGSHVECIVR